MAVTQHHLIFSRRYDKNSGDNNLPPNNGGPQFSELGRTVQVQRCHECNMSSRKYHQKSKNGCAACKRRRIKCDETRPSCRSCLRTEMTCMYPGDATVHVRNPRSERGSVAPSPAPPLPKESHDEHTFDLLDLGLMNHFDTVTSVYLFPMENARPAWQRVVPLEAQNHPLLMHGILALSAVHFACLHSSEAAEYRIRALHHQNIAVQMYSPALSAMNKENAHALFAFSIILAILAFASPRLGDAPPNIDDILEKFSLMHGSMIMWRLEGESILKSPMAALLPAKIMAEESVLGTAATAAFTELEAFADDPVYVAAIKLLKVCASLAVVAPHEVPMSARWPAEVEDEFWKRCKAHEPKALLVLAHYAIVLRKYQQTWWLEGWSDLLIKVVSQALSESDKELVGWEQRMEFLLHA